MIKDPKQKKELVLLSGLLTALVAVLYYYAFSGGTNSDTRAISAKKMSSSDSVAEIKDLVISRNPRRTGGKKEVPLRDVDPTIHLERLIQFDPGTPVNARNMFSLDAPPAAPTPIGRPPRHAAISGPGSTANSEPGMGNGRTPQPPPVNINLKFIGFALNSDQKTRQGFFTEGDEVYLALEGQLVANRYRVLHISDASAEIEEVTSKTRRQISLVTQ